jgi:uncharacterized membrane protein
MRTWPILWRAQSVVVVAYFVLILGWPRKGRGANWLFWLIVALVWIRIVVPFVLGYGSAYRVSVVCLGIAGAVGVLTRTKILMAGDANDVKQVAAKSRAS